MGQTKLCSSSPIHLPYLLYIALGQAPPHPTQLFACLGMKNEDRLLTLLVAEGFRDGGAVTEIRPPPPLTGDLLSSLAEKKIDVFC